MSLLQMSFLGTVIILLIVVLRAVLINRLPKKTFLILWWIALIRLLVPFSIKSVTSIYSLLQSIYSDINPVRTAQTTTFLPIHGNMPEIANGLSEAMVQRTESISILSVIWLAGLLLCFGFFAVSYIKCYREFRFSLPVENDILEAWKEKHPLKRSLSIRQTETIAAPLSYGVIRPVILMPKNTEWKNIYQLRYVLEHEYVHIRRLDMLTKLIMIAAVCIHWFNPLVWVMYILFNRDLELSCDETVVRRFGMDIKSVYATALISMEEKKSGLTPLCNSFSKNAIEERIRAIMKIKKTSVFEEGGSENIAADDMGEYSSEEGKGLNIAVPQEYADYGVSCDAQGNWVYNGKIIADLYDEGRGIFSNSNGTMYIEVTRDKSGKISSFQKVSKNRMQELFTEFNPEAETFDGYTSEAKH